MTVDWVSNILQSVAKTGKKKYWKIQRLTDGKDWYYKKIWWQEGSKVQESSPVKVEPKNVGRANETTPRQQVDIEIASIILKQKDKGYSLDGSTDHIRERPMLAHKWQDKKHKVQFPVYVQPKLDGHRMLMRGTSESILVKGRAPSQQDFYSTEDTFEAWTRGGKDHVKECVEHLMFNTNGFILDGEVILPGNRPLQESARAIKKFRPESRELLYIVYDIVMPNDSYESRFTMLEFLEVFFPKNVQLIRTEVANNEAELFCWHAEFVKMGYEGTIVRWGDGTYLSGHRSSNLLKYKDFQDSEWPIVDIEEGVGSFEGHGIFVCETSDGKRFKATPEGTMEYRKEIWNNREWYIGRWATIRYQSLSEDGIPIFPVGLDVRELGEF